MVNKTKKKYPQTIDNLSIKESIYDTQWKGSGYDIIFAFIYLYKKHKNFYTPISDIETYSNRDMMWNVTISFKCNINNTYKLTFPCSQFIFFKKVKKYIKNFENNKKKKFILIPLFLGSADCNSLQGHFNFLILNIEKMTIERFEPYGSNLYQTNHKLFDKNIRLAFKKNKINLKLITPKNFMPKETFQTLDEYERDYGIASLRPNDPVGFCAAWGVWFANMRLKYPNISSKELITKSENIIKNKKNFRNFIRNYSQFLIKQRKKMLGNSLEKIPSQRITKKILSLIKN